MGLSRNGGGECNVGDGRVVLLADRPVKTRLG